MDTKQVNSWVAELPKQVKVIVTYPCRLQPIESYIGKKYKYGEKLTMEKEDAIEAIGLKRVVLEKDFNADKYPCPKSKIRGDKEDVKTPPKSPVK